MVGWYLVRCHSSKLALSYHEPYVNKGPTGLGKRTMAEADSKGGVGWWWRGEEEGG